MIDDLIVWLIAICALSRLVSLKEFADMLGAGLTAKKLWNLIDKEKEQAVLRIMGQEVPVFKIGVPYYVKRADLDFLDEPTSLQVAVEPPRKTATNRGRPPKMRKFKHIDPALSGNGK